MNAPPQTGWFNRMFGWIFERENRSAFLGFSVWILIGIVLYALFRSASMGTAILIGSLWFLSIGIFARTTVRNLFGPVFLYETVRVGRRRFTFILRTVYLLVLMITLTIVFLQWLGNIGYWNFSFTGIRPNQLSQYGDMAFQYFVPIQFGFICLITPAYVAGIIADEKERKTLEFLFATDLQNREIIFGKLAARIVTLMMYIIAGLPILSSLMLFGGIDPQMLLATYVCTIITMLSLASLSIYFSTCCRKPRDAIVLTYFVATLYIVITLIASVYLSNYKRMYGPMMIFSWEVPTDDIGMWLGAGNPLFIFTDFFLVGGSIDDLVWKYLMIHAVFITAFLSYSILRLRTIALLQSYGMAREKKASLRPACGQDPVFWKEVFVENSPRRLWLVICGNFVLYGLTFMWPVMIFVNTYFDSFYNFNGFNPRSNKTFQEDVNIWMRITTGIYSFLMMMGATVRGASSVTSEKDRDTWISLLASPLTSWEILIGKWWGAVLSTRRIGWVLISVWAFAMFVGSVYPFMLIPTIFYLAIYVSTFAWLGVFCSCTARNTLIASIRAMMAGLFFTGGFWLLLIFCCFMPLSIGGNSSSRDTALFVATSFASLTPPFVMGWLPLNSFDQRSMMLFHPSERPHIGPSVVILGVFLWAGFAAVLAIFSLSSFRKQANRSDDEMLERDHSQTPDQKPEY